MEHWNNNIDDLFGFPGWGLATLFQTSPLKTPPSDHDSRCHKTIFRMQFSDEFFAKQINKLKEKSRNSRDLLERRHLCRKCSLFYFAALSTLESNFLHWSKNSSKGKKKQWLRTKSLLFSFDGRWGFRLQGCQTLFQKCSQIVHYQQRNCTTERETWKPWVVGLRITDGRSLHFPSLFNVKGKIGQTSFFREWVTAQEEIVTIFKFILFNNL